jgi:hypothetical protein
MGQTCIRLAMFVLPLIVLDPFAHPQPQDVYVLPVEVQQKAKENGVYDQLGTPDKITLYVNTITAIDVIAKERAKILARPVQKEDYEAGGWILCVLPWTPPKTDADKMKIREARPSLVSDIFISSDRRTDLIRRLKTRLLGLSEFIVEQVHLQPSTVIYRQTVRWKAER